MAAISSFFTSLLCFLAAIGSSTAMIQFTHIKSEYPAIIPLHNFGFSRKGVLELNISIIWRLDYVPLPDSSQIGFIFSSKGEKNRVLRSLRNDLIACKLQHDLLEPVFTFRSVNSSNISFVFSQTEPGEFMLVFANCLPYAHVEIEVTSSMYNVDPTTGAKDYLSVGYTNLPVINLVFFVFYTLLSLILVVIRVRNHLTGSRRIHYFMFAAVVLKAFNLLCQAKNSSHTKRTGLPHRWTLIFRTFSFLSRTMLFTLIALTGTGLFFLKPHLLKKEKTVVVILILLQAAGEIFYDNVVLLFMIVYIVCCYVALRLVKWFLKYLKNTARIDTNPVHLKNFKVFKKYSIAVKLYFCITRLLRYVFHGNNGHEYLWFTMVPRGVATFALFAYICIKFKPEWHNPYSPVNDHQEGLAFE